MKRSSDQRLLLDGSVPTINPNYHSSPASSALPHKGKGKATIISPPPLLSAREADPSNNAAGRRGWLAHQSIFPTSSARAQSPLEASGLTPSPVSNTNKLEETNSPEIMRQELRNHTLDGSRRGNGIRRGSTSSSSSASFTDGSYDDDDLGSSEGEDDLSDAGFDDPTRLNDPIALGVEGVEVPPRLEVLDDRMGYWANGRETIAKYNGKSSYRDDLEFARSSHLYLVDPLWLALWLFSLVAVMVGLCFVWGATDVSRLARFRLGSS